MKIPRIIHDLFHVAIVPFSALVVFGMVNDTVRGWVERFDLVIHLLLLYFAAESMLDWYRCRKKRLIAEAHSTVESQCMDCALTTYLSRGDKTLCCVHSGCHHEP